MSFTRKNECCCDGAKNYYPKIIATSNPEMAPAADVLGFGSLRGETAEIVFPTATPVPFSVAGPLRNVSVSGTGNELVVMESGVYQITVSLNAVATSEPDPTQSFFTASITVNGAPIFLQGLALFNVLNRSSSTYVVQAELAAGDQVGVSVSSNSPLAGYTNRSLTVVQLSH
ncbi:hypothetical protein MHB44_12240 [Lysinibacillus sp. FSL H8-0500]|uniref:hypothetical protein n=1 Tax=Lysinibacillus sp. FSL H8-0500 TaxID=2921393 RepID=UPI003100E09A